MMAIDQTTECTTAELRAIVDLTPGRLSQLESAGVIKRLDKDRWPLVATVRALLTEARARTVGLSEARVRLEHARAKAMELRTAREAGELAPTQEWFDGMKLVTGKIVAALVGLPARYTRDLGERSRLDGMISQLRTDVADWIEAEAASLEEAAKKSARRRA
jgi:hypothetical protein